MIDATFVKSITDLARAEVLKIEGVEFATRTVHDVRKPDPLPATLEFSTLAGFAGYIGSGIDLILASSSVIHVENERSVALVSGISPGYHPQRKVLARAKVENIFGKSFPVNSYFGLEEFIVGLRSMFEDKFDLPVILSILGNLEEQESRSHNDDGISQTVVARTGIAKVGEIKIPLPATLAPYRTFREVAQPPSPFIVRLRKGSEGAPPQAALFEADGGSWKLEAIKRIIEIFGTDEYKPRLRGLEVIG